MRQSLLSFQVIVLYNYSIKLHNSHIQSKNGAACQVGRLNSDIFEIHGRNFSCIKIRIKNNKRGLNNIILSIIND